MTISEVIALLKSMADATAKVIGLKESSDQKKKDDVQKAEDAVANKSKPPKEN